MVAELFRERTCPLSNSLLRTRAIIGDWACGLYLRFVEKAEGVSTPVVVEPGRVSVESQAELAARGHCVPWSNEVHIRSIRQ